MSLLLLVVFTLTNPLSCKEIAAKKMATPAAKKSAVPAIPLAQQIAKAPQQASLADTAKVVPATTPMTSPGQTSAAQTKMIVIANDITDDMITYKGHFTGPHKPSSFTTYINGTEIQPGSTSHIPLPENQKVHVVCKYEFKKAFIKKEREKVIALDPKDEKLSVRFSWNDDDRIIVHKTSDKKELPVS
jgi:hypothetical protein